MHDLSALVRERRAAVSERRSREPFSRAPSALSILVAANAALIAQSSATQNATGRVTAVAADSITIQTSTETLTLFVDSSTKVIGKGVGTITGRLKAEGRPAVVADLVHQYDSVRVKYAASADQGPRATEIRIVVKAVRKQ